LPVLFFVHGGSWSSGDKNIYPLLGKRFIAHGFVVVIINYSHFPAETFPAYSEDAAAALAWTVERIADYHGDSDQIFIVGHSAGAHILSLVALDDRYLAAHRLTRNFIRGFICISGPTDLTLLLEHVAGRPDMGTREQVIAIMGGPDQLRDADPVQHARPDAPPILFIHGSEDATAPIELARSFAAALTHAGAPVEFLEYPGATHISLLLDGVLPSRRAARLVVDSTAFMRRLADRVV
jgi:acetyl esterase/lipase